MITGKEIFHAVATRVHNFLKTRKELFNAVAIAVKSPIVLVHIDKKFSYGYIGILNIRFALLILGYYWNVVLLPLP
mgnify:CR=1 FL=1